jgi:2-dehydropantoate 2-reductase
MTILVIGGGAVGSFMATTLATGGNDVTILRRGGVPGLTRESFAVVDPNGETRTVELDIAGAPEAVAPDPGIVILAVKMPDLAGAIDVAARWPDVPVLAVENGVGADQVLLETRPSGGLIAGSLTAAIELEREGARDLATIRRLSRGGIGLAPVRGDVRATIERLAAGFEAGGLRSRQVPDPGSMRWSKLLANLLANATSAILDLDPAAIYRDKRTFAIERQQLREALAVIRRLGYRLVGLPGADMRPLQLAGRLPAALV